MKKTLLNLGKNYFTLMAFLITSIAFGQDYFDSNGTIIWNATANSGYNNNINLIGRDDAISLNQKQNTVSVPAIGLGTIAASNAANTNTFGGDRRYLVWGDNAGTMADSGTDVTVSFAGGTGISTSIDIVNKKWKIVESGGDVASTKISIATSALISLPTLSGNDAYVLVVADDASFTSNVETVFLTSSTTKQEAMYDFDGTKYFTYGVAHQNTFSRNLTLDGINDVVKFDAVNNLTTSFTMMFWVRPTGQNALANDRTIASKYNGSVGYRIYLAPNNKVMMNWAGGTTLASATSLPNNQWHHITITYNNSSYKLYIDGVIDTTITSTGPTAVPNLNTVFSIGAEYRNKSDIRNYFKGELDEFRFWNKALNANQLRFIINQEIVQNGIETAGAILTQATTRNDIKSIRWVNLLAYYSMNNFIGSGINDDSSFNNRGSLLSADQVNFTAQTAPMPYFSAANGAWTNTASWQNGAIQSLPNDVSIINGSTKIIWNIVKTSHDLTSNSSSGLTLMGLFVNSNTLSVTGDSKIEVSHYLKLDGKIDLVGKSQLLQPLNSDLDASSSGYLERDQLGQANKYNYNYWSSPVSSINTSSNNAGFSIANVMKDGTTTSPQNLNWTPDIDGSPTSPITLSSYWVFNFQEMSEGYANWGTVGESGEILPGQGYTLKGPGVATPKQNYTFVGKPNNGTITSPISSNNLNLCGNPYPSALDANAFIDANAASITGTLYFWEHYSTNTSHVTSQYQGGYATYTKTGGTSPVSPSEVSGLGSSNRVPKRYIPVGQGFFVRGSITGGTITFNNSQRTFIKEDNSKSYLLFRAAAGSPVTHDSESGGDDTPVEEQFTKLHLGFDSVNNYHRQILIGFMNENATPEFDNGYDGMSMEMPSNDMYFIMQDGTKLNIQGVGAFNTNDVYPIGVKNAQSGIVKFGVDNFENMPENQDVFIFDNVTNEYHSIKTEKLSIELPSGIYDNRFSLRFFNPNALGTHENELENGIAVIHSQSDDIVNIKNQLLEANIKTISLYNMIGQNITDWKVSNQDQSDINISVANLNSGAYIVKINTDKGSMSKKIIIN